MENVPCSKKFIIKSFLIYVVGLFSKKIIKKNSLIGEYHGDRIDDAMADMRKKSLGKCRSNYMVRISSTMILGGSFCCCSTKYTYNCCEPNTVSNFRMIGDEKRLFYNSTMIPSNSPISIY